MLRQSIAVWFCVGLCNLKTSMRNNCLLYRAFTIGSSSAGSDVVVMDCMWTLAALVRMHKSLLERTGFAKFVAFNWR